MTTQQNQTQLKKFIEKLLEEVDCKEYRAYCSELIRSFILSHLEKNCYAINIEHDYFTYPHDPWRIKCYRDRDSVIADDWGGFATYIDALNYILRLRSNALNQNN